MNTEYLYYRNLFKGNYRKGVNTLKNILDSDLLREALVDSYEGLHIIIAYDREKPDPNALQLIELLNQGLSPEEHYHAIMTLIKGEGYSGGLDSYFKEVPDKLAYGLAYTIFNSKKVIDYLSEDSESLKLLAGNEVLVHYVATDFMVNNQYLYDELVASGKLADAFCEIPLVPSTVTDFLDNEKIKADKEMTAKLVTDTEVNEAIIRAGRDPNEYFTPEIVEKVPTAEELLDDLDLDNEQLENKYQDQAYLTALNQRMSEICEKIINTEEGKDYIRKILSKDVTIKMYFGLESFASKFDTSNSEALAFFRGIATNENYSLIQSLDTYSHVFVRTDESTKRSFSRCKKDVGTWIELSPENCKETLNVGTVTNISIETPVFPKSLSYWFQGKVTLPEVTSLERLFTQCCTDFSYTFAESQLGSWDTYKTSLAPYINMDSAEKIDHFQTRSGTAYWTGTFDIFKGKDLSGIGDIDGILDAHSVSLIDFSGTNLSGVKSFNMASWGTDIGSVDGEEHLPCKIDFSNADLSGLSMFSISSNLSGSAGTEIDLTQTNLSNITQLTISGPTLVSVTADGTNLDNLTTIITDKNWVESKKHLTLDFKNLELPNLRMLNGGAFNYYPTVNGTEFDLIFENVIFSSLETLDTGCFLMSAGTVSDSRFSIDMSGNVFTSLSTMQEPFQFRSTTDNTFDNNIYEVDLTGCQFPAMTSLESGTFHLDLRSSPSNSDAMVHGSQYCKFNLANSQWPVLETIKAKAFEFDDPEADGFNDFKCELDLSNARFDLLNEIESEAFYYRFTDTTSAQTNYDNYFKLNLSNISMPSLLTIPSRMVYIEDTNNGLREENLETNQTEVNLTGATFETLTTVTSKAFTMSRRVEGGSGYVPYYRYDFNGMVAPALETFEDVFEVLDEDTENPGIMKLTIDFTGFPNLTNDLIFTAVDSLYSIKTYDITIVGLLLDDLSDLQAYVNRTKSPIVRFQDMDFTAYDRFTDFINYEGLADLELTNCQLPETMNINESDFVSSLKSLLIVDTEENNIQTMSLDGCSALENINFSGSTFNSMTSLSINNASSPNINLSGTKFTVMETLPITGSTVGTLTLDNLTSDTLTKIDLSNSTIATISTEDSSFGTLQTIDLTGSKITNFNLNGNTFETLTSITTTAETVIDNLDFSGTTFNALENLSFAGSGVKKVDLSEVVITGNPEISFANCASMTELDLTDADISEYSGNLSLEGCAQLKKITAPRCNLRSMEGLKLDSCTTLGTVDFSAATLTSMVTMTFVGCDAMTNLTYTGADMDALGALDLSARVGLEEVNFADCKMSGIIVINMTGCTALTKADYSNCTFTTKLTSITFSGCSLMTEVHFVNDDISAVTNTDSMFATCPTIFTVDFAGATFNTSFTWPTGWLTASAAKLKNIMFSGAKGGVEKMNPCTILGYFSTLENADFSKMTFSSVGTMSSWSYSLATIKRIDFSECNFTALTALYDLRANRSADYQNTGTEYIFDKAKFPVLNRISNFVNSVGTQYFKTISMKDCSFPALTGTSANNMFYPYNQAFYCDTIDISGCDFSKLTGQISYMFYADSTTKVRHINFSNCNFSGLTSINYFMNLGNNNNAIVDVKDCNFSKVTTCNYMFTSNANSVADALESIDISGCNFSLMTSWSYYVYNTACYVKSFKMDNLDMRAWTTATMTDSNIFQYPAYYPDKLLSLKGIHLHANVKTLNFNNTNTKDFGFSGENTQVTTLNLNTNTRLETVDFSGGASTTLVTLNMTGCNKINSINMEDASFPAMTAWTFDKTALKNVNMKGCSMGAMVTLDLSSLPGLASLDISGGEFKAMTTLNLSSCAALKTLNLSGKKFTALTTLNLTGTNAISDLDFSGATFDAMVTLDLTGKTQITEGKFTGSNFVKLTTLNLTNCSLMSNLDMSGSTFGVLQTITFTGCSALASVDMSGAKINTANLNISGCDSLTSLDLSSSTMASLNNLTVSCKNLETLNLKESNLAVKTLKIQSDKIAVVDLTGATLDTLSSLDLTSCPLMTSLIIAPETVPALVTLNLTNDTIATLDQISPLFPQLTGLILTNTRLTDVNLTSYDFSKLVTLNLSGITTMISLDISNMEFPALTTITTLGGCSALETVNMSHTNFPVLASLANLFSSGSNNCKALQSVDLSYATFGSLNNVSGMFCNTSGDGNACTALETVDFSHAAFNALSSMSSLFADSSAEYASACTGLASVDLTEANLTALSDMSNMFADATDSTHKASCTSLRNVKFDKTVFASLTNISSMFGDADSTDCSCTNLEELDFTGIDMTKASSLTVNAENMFYNCSGLKKIICEYTWTSVLENNNLFYNNQVLVGDITYNEGCLSRYYATPNGGYFTRPE